MSLLNDTQIARASTDDLVTLLQSIKHHLRARDVNALLATAQAFVANRRLFTIAKIEIGVDEWDNGYFYSGVTRIEDTQGNEIHLSLTTIDELEDELDGLLTPLSYDNHPGRHGGLDILVKEGRVTY